MSDTSKRELIEGTAYERYPDIEADPPGTSTEDAKFPTGWSRELERNAFIAGAVFEQAHTPTDDEQEAARIAQLDARQAAHRKHREDYYADYEDSPEIATNSFFDGWDAAVEGGFRRTAVPEPQAEPTDAQVLAALNAYYADYMIGPNKSLSEVRPPRTVHDMRAALRAAFKAGGAS